MKTIKRLLTRGTAVVLAAILLVGLLPAQALAAGVQGSYSIANDYMKYTINTKTGGFCIETVAGHPQKSFDNNIPLLYKEDPGRSSGTSFLTVRIDGKDYIFGQDYGWFGIESTLSTPVVSNEGRLITIKWSIKGYEITQKVALSIDQNNPMAGNVGLSYEVKNNNSTAGTVGIRLLLDNALDSKIDAPYVVTGGISPTLTETELTAEAKTMPQQIRYMDSLSGTAQMAYVLLGGWSGEGDAIPDRVIVGHWANLANTRYNYTPDPNCDFSNYSNAHRVPDTATAFYWSERDLAPGALRTSELLYGVGDFSKELTDQRLAISTTIADVQLDETGKAYENGGVFDLTLTLDNTVDNARDFTALTATVVLEEGLKFQKDNSSTATFSYSEEMDADHQFHKGDTKNISLKVVAATQAQITSKRISVAINGTERVSDTEDQKVDYGISRNVLLPAVGGKLPDIQMTQFSPERIYYQGEKNISISGRMKEFEALESREGWDLYLVSDATGEQTLIEKKDIAFTDEAYTNMAIQTNKELAVGSYSLRFAFRDAQLKESFGAAVTAACKLQVTSDPEDRTDSYGLVTMVRFGNSHFSEYDLISFYNEAALNAFLKGGVAAAGLAKKSRTFNPETDEALVTARGRLRLVEATRDTPAHYLSTGTEVTLNNILVYGEGDAFVMHADKDGVSMRGDGTIKVINSINIWHNQWSLSAENEVQYTLVPGEGDDGEGNSNVKSLELSLDGAGSMVQFVAGFAINLKYGVFTKDAGKDPEKDESRYGISFGGSITLPIGMPKKKEAAKPGPKPAAAPAVKPEPKPEPGGGAPEEEEKTQLSAAVDSLLYGQRTDGETGFVGLNTTIGLALPENVLGSLIQNGPGVEATVTINTITNFYSLEFAVNMAILECEGLIAFKQVPIRGIDTVVPDALRFKLGGDVVSVPIVPPFVSMTGIGGGISELADSLSDDNVGELPPMTIHIMMDLCMLETMIGKFEAAVSLQGMSLEGDFHLRADEDGQIFNMQAGMATQWITPFFISAYGNINVCDGIIRGSFSAKISSNYFYGYIFAGIFIPQSIPFVGGMEIAAVEAAISSDFIGANVRIIGIQFGVIYYWDGELKFGSSLDLSSRGAAVTYMPQSYYNDQGQQVEATMVYGTNLRRISSTTVPGSRAGSGTIVKDFDPREQDALLLEIPFTGTTPAPEEVTLTTPTGKTITMVPDDGMGGGNFLVQDRGAEGKYLYITITDPNLLEEGRWTVAITTQGLSAQDFAVNGVDNLPLLTGVEFSHASESSKELNIAWTTDCEGALPGTLDVYLTKDPQVFEKLDVEKTNADSIMAPLARLELADTKTKSAKVEIPDTFEEGEYYLVCMLSQHEGGISKVISKAPFRFTNDKLPPAPTAVALSYGGNGGLSIQVTDPAQPTYDSYLVTLLDEHGTPVPGGYGEYPQGQPIYFNVNEKDTNTSLLKAGSVYSVAVATKRTEAGGAEEYRSYFSTASALSEPYTMPKANLPKLLSVESNIGPDISCTAQTHLTATYRFDQPVYFYPTLDSLPIFRPTEAKTEWRMDTDLEDGIHAVLFTAVNEAGDRSLSYDFESLQGENKNAVPGAALTFETDSQAPVLTMAQSEAKNLDSKKGSTGTSGQTVFAAADGTIVLSGLCEKNAVLTLDGSAEGVLIQDDGTFTITRKVDTTKAYGQLTLKAVDKAGNSTSLTISVVNKDLAAFDSLLLISSIDPAKDAKYVELSLGQTLTLTPKMKSAETELRVAPADVTWQVLYEQNTIALSNGQVTALAPGETAVKATYRTASYSDDGAKNTEVGLSNVILIHVKDAGYQYKLIQTGTYTFFSVIAPEDRGNATVTLGDKTTMLLYDKANGCYVGVFAGTQSSDTLVTNMTFAKGQVPPPLQLGDTDGDGTLSRRDVDAAIDCYLKAQNIPAGDLNTVVRVDMNGDRKINIVDAQLVLQALYHTQGGN